MTSSPQLIKTLAKKANRTESYVRTMWEQIGAELIVQGMIEDEKRFYPYLITRLKKKLGIKEASPILKRFKTFLNERKTE